MTFVYTRATLCAALLALVGLTIAAHAVEIPIKIPGCPERDGTDRSKDDADVEGRRAQDDQSVCGGGGAGSDAAYAYPGVRSPAVGGGGGGGGGGGSTSTRTGATQTSATELAAAQPSGSTSDVIQSTPSPNSIGNPNQSTSGTTSGGTPAPQPVTDTPSVQTGNPTANVINPATAPSGFSDGTFDGSSTSVGHVAPLPDLGGGLSWFIALMAAVFFYRKRIRV